MMAEKHARRNRIEASIQGERPDRVPVALWRHFPVDDQTPEGLAAATMDFQKQYDFDFVKVTPASSFCLKDWGVQDEWRGATEGTRTYTHHVIQQPDDWKKLEVLDPYHGSLGNQLACLDILVRELHAQGVPVIQTVFNPLAQAKNLAGGEMLFVHLRQFPDAVHEGLQKILETTQQFMDASLKTGIDGFFYAVQHASSVLLSEQEYRIFGRAYDLQLLSQADSSWLNMIHLHGEHVLFDLFVDYPAQVINWHDRDTAPDLAEALKRFPGALCGGLQRERTMVLGNPVSVTAEAHDAILATGSKRFILGTGCVLPTIAPRANILAARRSVDSSR